MPLVDQPFAATFVFSRARSASYVDATGAVAEAGPNTPRWDHDAEGAPRGLLIEGRPEFDAADRLTVQAGDWSQARGTVLHEIETPAGLIEHRAWYVRNSPQQVVNGCLNAKGRHRRIAYVPGHLKNRDGVVRWRNAFWALGGIVQAADGAALAATDTDMMLEG